MKDYIFLLKENKYDRDCCIYFDLDKWNKDKRIGFCGNCFWGRDLEKEIDFDNIKTILTKEELLLLNDYDLYNSNSDSLVVANIIQKLLSENNEKLYKEVIEEEIEYIQEYYGIDRKDIEYIFENYFNNERTDRSCICYVWDNYYDIGENWYFDCCSKVDEFVERFIDFEEMGKEIVSENSRYYELDNGKIIETSDF